MATKKPNDVENLSIEDELLRIQKELAETKLKLSEAEKTAENYAEAANFLGTSAEEYPTGQTETVEKCVNPWERDAKKQKFITIELPLFKYQITLPAGAGLYISVNGQEYYHGKTYTVNSDLLATLRDMVARTWYHEKSIHGDNENAYRKPTHRVM